MGPKLEPKMATAKYNNMTSNQYALASRTLPSIAFAGIALASVALASIALSSIAFAGIAFASIALNSAKHHHHQRHQHQHHHHHHHHHHQHCPVESCGSSETANVALNKLETNVEQMLEQQLEHRKQKTEQFKLLPMMTMMMVMARFVIFIFQPIPAMMNRAMSVRFTAATPLMHPPA